VAWAGDGQPGTVLAPGAVEGDGKGKRAGGGQHSLKSSLAGRVGGILARSWHSRASRARARRTDHAQGKYTAVHTTVPSPLRHFKRTYTR